MNTGQGAPFEFKLQFSLSVSKDGGKARSDDSPDKLQKLLQFLQKRRDIISDFFSKNFESASVHNFELKEDEIVCFARATTMHGLELLSEATKGVLSSQLTTVLSCHGLDSAMGSQSYRESNIVNVELTGKMYRKGVEYFEDQSKRLSSAEPPSKDHTGEPGPRTQHGAGLNVLLGATAADPLTSQRSVSTPLMNSHNQNSTANSATDTRVEVHGPPSEQSSSNVKTIVPTCETLIGATEPPPNQNIAMESKVETTVQVQEPTSESAKDEQVIIKRFSLFIPDDVLDTYGHTLRKIALSVFKAKGKHFLDMEFKPNGHNSSMWDSPPFAFTIEEANYLRYSYTLWFKKGKSKKVLDVVKTRSTDAFYQDVQADENTSRPLISETSVHRDTFMSEKFDLIKQSEGVKGGFFNHVEAMSIDVSRDTLKEFSMQLEYLHFPHSMEHYTTRKQFIEFLNSVSALNAAKGLFFLTSLSLFTFYTHDLITSTVTQDLAASMVMSLTVFSREQLLESRVHPITELLPALLKVAFGKDVSWDVCLIHLFPFLSLSESKSLKKFFKGRVLLFETVRPALQHLCRLLPHHKEAEDLVVTLVKDCVNVNLLIQVENWLNAEKASMTYDQHRKFVSCIHKTYVDQLQMKKVNPQNDKEFEEVLKQWQYIVRSIGIVSSELVSAALGLRQLKLIIQVGRLLKEKAAWCDESVANRFDREFKHQLRCLFEEELGRLSHINAILDKWVLFKENSEPCSHEDGARLTRRKIFEVCSGISGNPHKVELDALETLLLDEILYSSTPDFIRLVSYLASHSGAALRNMFINILGKVKIFTPDLHESAMTFYSTQARVIKRSGHPLSSKITYIYNQYFQIVDIPVVKESKEFCQELDNKVQHDISAFGEEALCYEIPKLETMSDKTQEMFEKHLKNIFMASSSFRCTTFKADKIYVCSRLLLVPLEALLTFEKVPSCERIGDPNLGQTLTVILKHAKFWYSILSATGQYAVHLTEHVNTKKVTNALVLVINSFKSYSAPVHIAKSLVEIIAASDKEYTFLLLEFISGKITNVISAVQSDIDQAFSNIKKFRAFQKVFLPMYTQHPMCDIVEFSDGLNEIENKVAKSDMCTLSDIRDGKRFWGRFITMIEQVSLLDKLKSSKVFLKYSRSTLLNSDLSVRETDGGSSFTENSFDDEEMGSGLFNLHVLYDNEDSEEADAENEVCALERGIPVLTVADYLTRDTLDKFKADLEPFFEGRDVSVAQVRDLFQFCDPLEIEIDVIEQLFNRKFHFSVRAALANFLEYGDRMEQVKNIKEMLKNFSVALSKDDDLDNALSSLLSCAQHEEVTLLQISTSVQCIKDLLINQKADAILSELAQSKNLISFIQDNQDEDFRNLIDAVEEHSDSFVRDAHVSQLIEVKRFLYPLMRVVRDRNGEMHAREFLDFFIKACRSVPDDMASKVNGCSEHFHALKTLHSSVANRGEMTKSIILNIMKVGKFVFNIKSGECDVTVSYTRDHQKRSYSLQELSDLKSRALLITNKDSSGGGVEDLASAKMKETLKEFITVHDAVYNIVQTSTGLHRSGHFSYRAYSKKVTQRGDLVLLSAALDQDQKNWAVKLMEARRKYFFLNFVYSSQIWTLFDFFKDKKDTQRAKYILQFINPGITCEDIQLAPFNSNGDKLDFVGEQLHRVFNAAQIVKRPLGFSDSSVSLKDLVLPGLPLIIHQAEGSVSVVKTVLKVYGSLSNCYPQSHQVLFCSPDSEWEEIRLLLLRYISSKVPEEVFCVANVELLPNELQFALVDEVKEMMEQFELYEHPVSFLCLVCKGSASQPILGKFPKLVQRIQPLHEKDVEACLQSACPNVVTVTSTVPGLGKSETIRDISFACDRVVVHFPISGPFNKRDIVRRLQKANVTRCSLLHLDIGEVDCPYLLEMFIFELVVLGMVSAGTERFALPTEYVYIELANTVKQRLRNALYVCTCFRRLTLQWENYDNFLVSKEMSSPVQVVCYYLQALENATVDTHDIHFSESSKLKPLRPDCCRDLLRRYLTLGDDMSFTVVEVFLNVLADQLRKFSASQFFQAHILKSMVGDKSNVKSTLVEAMIDVFKSFASRSVKTYREAQADVIESQQSATLIKTGNDMIDRVDGMIRWADTNHLLVIFHSQDFNTVSALYRNKEDVPKQITNLFKTQIKRPLPDFARENQTSLQTELEKIVRTTQLPPTGLPKDYALTPDNLLKMVLIFLRIKAGVPVLIMGETGCGKTSLITYLAKTTGCYLEIFNIHAGIQQETVLERVKVMHHKAQSNPQLQYWLFMDEINTCDHLGLISEMLCHRTFLGHAIASNLIMLAACNPYKARNDDKILTSGLEGKVKTDTRSNLVYRVLPLPESMIDYVWDYGSLNESDEKAYITRMVNSVFPGNKELLTDLLSSSQDFTRSYESNNWCVSLRDVKRCISLCDWFLHYYMVKKYEHDKENEPTKSVVSRNSIILSLAHCYYSRLPTSEARILFCDRIAEIFWKHGTKVNSDVVRQIIRKEQRDLVDKMDLPESTAKNTALCENVFVILVCILNKIPIFVVGKPGCSKSLSVQLLRSNLRGPDSRNDFFKSLPHMYVVSYQGSESSTSEGIIKVFDKAKRYKESNKTDEVLPVVLLDEIGLAEQSKSNPLKVLHSLLEPVGGNLPDVAVVGISNWALDAAKMNRAIHLSRPEPDQAELYDTAHSISTYVELDTSFSLLGGGQDPVVSRLTEEELQAVSKAYFEYQRNQTHRNFHGLRDYYSLIKYLSKNSNGNLDIELWKKGLLRNFGGLTFETHTIVNKFLSFVNPVEKCEAEIPVKELVQENVNDTSARHLMLITHGDSALGILENFINLQNRQHEIIFGSKFEEDLSEDYNYRMLSRIILCMEQGVILVLRDLENIYGSLYDMLNQNYSFVGSEKRKHCRIALGPYSNPMCFVHDEFRCVVLVDLNKVDYSDPPFLNRFEKQLLTFKDILTRRQSDVIQRLDDWFKGMCTIPNLTDLFNESSALVGFCTDLLPSLVLHIWPNSDCTEEEQSEFRQAEVLDKCKQELMWIYSPDGMLRASKSVLASENEDEVLKWQQCYFQLPIHNGLRSFLSAVHADQDGSWTSDETGFKIIVYTRSNIMFDVQDCAKELYSCQVEKLSVFKSEKQLTNRISQFWSNDKDLLVLQCKPSSDSQHILLAKSIIDRHRADYKKMETENRKHVVIVVHLDKENVDGWQFNYLSGWKLVNIDSLGESGISLPWLWGKQVIEVLEDESGFDINKSILNNMLWAFSVIKYPGKPRPTDNVVKLIKSAENLGIVALIKERILEWMRGHSNDQIVTSSSWHVTLACDSYALHNSSTVLEAYESYLLERVREPLAIIVFKLEANGAWSSFAGHDNFWRGVFLSREFLDIDCFPSYHEAGHYNLEGVCLDLSFPFTKFFVEALFDVRDVFLRGYQKLLEDVDFLDEDENILPSVYSSHQQNTLELIFESVPQLRVYFCSHSCDDFLDDFCDIVTAEHDSLLETEERIFIARWAINLHQEDTEQSPAEQVVQLVTNYWVRSSTVHSILRLASVCKDVAGTDVVDLIAATKVGMDINSEDTSEESVVENDDEPHDQGREEGDDNGKDIPDRITSSPEELLVDAACQVMLPTENVINACQNILNWQYKVNLVLSVASQVSSSSNTLYFLRTCNDFVVNLQIPYSLEDAYVSVIAECGSCQGDPLESNVMFNRVMIMAESLVEQKKVPLLEMQKFICLYVGRCFDSYKADGVCVAVDVYLERLSKMGASDSALHFFGTIIDRLWTEEIYNFPDLLTDILSSCDLEEHPNLQRLEGAFSQCTPLAVLTCDTVEAIFSETHSQLNRVDLEGENPNEILSSLKIALVTVHAKTELSLKIVVAVSFIKSILRRIALLLKDSQHFIKTEAANNFLQEISSLFEPSPDAIVSDMPDECCVTFLLKAFHECSSFQESILLINEYVLKIPALQRIKWTDDDFVNPLGFKVMSEGSSYQHAFTAFRQLLEGDNSAVKQLVTEATNSAENKLALLSVVVDNLYLVSGQRELKDSEKQAGCAVTKLLQEFPALLLTLSKCLCLETKFDLPILNLTPGTPTRDVQVASVMVHLVSMTACFANGGQCLFSKAVSDPSSLNNLFIPSTQDETLSHEELGETGTYECVCLHKVVTTTGSCPVCHTTLKKPTETVCQAEIPSALMEPRRGFWRYNPSRVYPRGMSSASFVIFRLLLNSSIATGYALMKNDLAGVYNQDEDALPHDMVLKCITEELGKMWEILESLLALPSHQVCCFVHALLRRLQPLLIDCNCSFATLEERAEWEQIFMKEVDELIRVRHRVIRQTMINTIVSSDNCVESAVDELNDTNTTLARLFRFTPLKSTKKLFGSYKLSELESKNPFLGLFFTSGKHLSILRYLKPILKWQNLIASCKSHHLSRKRSIETIRQVISEHKDPKEKQKLRDVFDEFTKAWNEIHPFLQELGTFSTLPILHDDCKVHECLAVSKESTVYKVIESLVQMQNSFLDKVLRMATSGRCIALSFLLRESSAAVIPVIPLAEAELSHILDFSWKDLKSDLLRLSQFNTVRGMGYDLEFDFTAIEIELSVTLVYGKAHLLLDSSFPFFAFAHELPLNSAVLAQIEKTIPQKALPDTAVAQLKDLNNANPLNTTTLKFDVDIVVDMLQKSRSQLDSPQTSILDYANRWYTVLNKHFPEHLLPQPGNTLKLCHLVSLSETLDELLSHNSEEKLMNKYRQQLDKTNDAELQTRLSKTTADLDSVIKLLRSFIYRYFSTREDQMPDESQPLINLLKAECQSRDGQEDQMLVKELEFIFTPVVQVQHSHTAVKHVAQVIQERLKSREYVKNVPDEKKKPTQKRKKFLIRKA